MQTETRQKQQSWTGLSGRILEGGYELKDLIEADDTGAIFRARVLGDRDLVAAALFLRLSPASSRYQIEVWEAVRAFRSPYLNSPLGSGVTDLEGAPVTFVVVRQSDESLTGVLRDRALTPAEMKDALLNAAKGLEVLHLNGLVHGSVSPEEVLALGDTIRLSGESVRTAGAAAQFERKPAQYLAPESSGINLTVESDVWCLGATVFESLTQKPWTEAQRSNVEALPEPFATIALRCLVEDPGRRCRLGEVVALVRGEIKPSPRPKPVPPPAAAQSVPAPAAVPASAAATTGETNPERQPVATDTTPRNGTGSSQKESTNTVPLEARTHASSSGASAGTAEPPATNGTLAGDPPIVEKSVPRDKVEARGPIRQPMPVLGKRPVPKVRPIQTAAYAPDPTPRREQLSAQRSEVEPDEPSSKMWLWAGLALLGVFLLVWALRPRTPATSKLSPSPNPSAVAGNAKPAPPVNSWETKTIQPDGTALASASVEKTKTEAAKGQHPAAAKSAVAGKVAEPVSAGGRVWRTVLYTYQREADAREKVKSLNSKHSNLHAELFSPSGNGAPYLISAGGRVSREEAVQLRRKAISVGMPRDTYIQNYSH